VHGDARIAEHRLQPRRGHVDVAGPVGERVAERDQLPLHLDVLDLGVGERRVIGGAPVDDPLAPVDQTGLVETDERHPDGVLEALVHREAETVPVAGVSERLHLLDDPAAEALPPGPDPLDERLAADRPLVEPLLEELAADQHLGPDPRVVGAREPERVVPLHAAATHDRVLDRVVEGVPDVQGPGHVRRGEDDAEGPAPLPRLGMEVPAVHPLRVPARLHPGRLVSGRDGRIHGRECTARSSRPTMDPGVGETSTQGPGRPIGTEHAFRRSGLARG
jgi:hypothetical protein